MDRRQTCLQMQDPMRETMPGFVRALCRPGPTALAEEDDLDWMNDPEKVEYIRQLIEALYESRAIVNCYNIVVIVAILVLAFLHWRETRSDERKWRRLVQNQGGVGDETDSKVKPTSSPADHAVAGTATPTLDTKDVDLERMPLLGKIQTAPKSRRRKMGAAVRSWLARQPPPLPVVNRTLPSNGTSLFILGWLAVNVFLHFYRLPMRWDFFFIFADRAGCVFVVNLPLLYLLSAKNQPLRALTGYSYEALNIFHRRVGELMCFEAALHFVGMLLWQFLLAREWLLASRNAYEYFTHPIILCGLGALAAYELLFLTSLASFRQRCYELFLAAHVVLQLAALVLLYFHYHTARPYVAAALAIFVADRLVWRLALKRAAVDADICILDADTYLLCADWDIPRPSRRRAWWWPSFGPFGAQSVLHGWRPTDHVFLTVPALGRTHALQAHPFTIASVAPGRHGDDTNPHDPDNTNETNPIRPSPKPTHAWLALLVRAHDGFTRDLLRHALSSSSSSSSSSPPPPPPPRPPPTRVSVRLDGPYGSPRALRMLRAAGCAVLVAGGSGIAVVFPLAWALLHEGVGYGDGDEDGGRDGLCPDQQGSGKRRRRVHLLWVTHSREHREWMAQTQLEELVARGLELVVPEPTAEAGRPDVTGLVAGWVGEAAAEGREVAVVVSGPDGLNRAVRNVCAEEMGRGREVRVAVEKFGW